MTADDQVGPAGAAEILNYKAADLAVAVANTDGLSAEHHAAARARYILGHDIDRKTIHRDILKGRGGHVHGKADRAQKGDIGLRQDRSQRRADKAGDHHPRLRQAEEIPTARRRPIGRKV